MHGAYVTTVCTCTASKSCLGCGLAHLRACVQADQQPVSLAEQATIRKKKSKAGMKEASLMSRPRDTTQHNIDKLFRPMLSSLAGVNTAATIRRNHASLLFARLRDTTRHHIEKMFRSVASSKAAAAAKQVLADEKAAAAAVAKANA